MIGDIADEESVRWFHLTTDDDGHWYIVPVDRKDDWDDWLYSDDAQVDVPLWAHRISDSPSLIYFSSYKEG